MRRDDISTLLLFLVLSAMMDPRRDYIGTLLLFLFLAGYVDGVRW